MMTENESTCKGATPLGGHLWQLFLLPLSLPFYWAISLPNPFERIIPLPLPDINSETLTAK